MIRHILVRHEYEAQDILKLLSEGKSFEALAARFSLCPSAKAGGQLGDLKGKLIDQEFAGAMNRLQPGQMSGVVRTRFGFHIIRRDQEST